jgi:hypothetical protein
MNTTKEAELSVAPITTMVKPAETPVVAEVAQPAAPPAPVAAQPEAPLITEQAAQKGVAGDRQSFARPRTRRFPRLGGGAGAAACYSLTG